MAGWISKLPRDNVSLNCNPLTAGICCNSPLLFSTLPVGFFWGHKSLRPNKCTWDAEHSEPIYTLTSCQWWNLNLLNNNIIRREGRRGYIFHMEMNYCEKRVKNGVYLKKKKKIYPILSFLVQYKPLNLGLSYNSMTKRLWQNDTQRLLIPGLKMIGRICLFSFGKCDPEMLLLEPYHMEKEQSGK